MAIITGTKSGVRPSGRGIKLSRNFSALQLDTMRKKLEDSEKWKS